MLFFGTSGCLQLNYFCYFCLVSCTIAMLKGYGGFLEQFQVRRKLNKKTEKWNMKFLNWDIAWMRNSEKPEKSLKDRELPFY